MHGHHVERSYAHFARDIQIQLILIQIGVFSQVKLIVLVLVDFVLSEVLTGATAQLLLSRRLDHPLLLLQD